MSPSKRYNATPILRGAIGGAIGDDIERWTPLQNPSVAYLGSDSTPVSNGYYRNSLTHCNKPPLQIPDNYFGVKHGVKPEDDSRAYTATPMGGPWIPEQRGVPILPPSRAPKLFQ